VTSEANTSATLKKHPEPIIFEVQFKPKSLHLFFSVNLVVKNPLRSFVSFAAKKQKAFSFSVLKPLHF
jgi:hypothetical protein